MTRPHCFDTVPDSAKNRLANYNNFPIDRRDSKWLENCAMARYYLRVQKGVTTMSDTLVEITEFTDPLCSIAWGTEPYKRLLQWRYGTMLNWRTVMAGLCKDNSSVEAFAPWDAYKAGQSYLKVWKRVTGITGMPYPDNLDYMAVTTDPPCLLVKAAELQGPQMADKVLRRFRESVFLYGTPVDAVDQAALALEGLDNLDFNKLLADAKTEAVQSAYLADWQQTRTPNDYVRSLAKQDLDHLQGGMMTSEGHDRYNLPTFIFSGPEGEKTVPGYRPFQEYEDALEAVAPGITANKKAKPSLEQAMNHWSTLTAQEEKLICDGSNDTSNAKRFACGGSHIWLNGSETAYWKKRKATAAD